MDELTTTPSMAEYYQMIKAEHEANNAWSAEQAQKAMDYQTEMSNSAHQREVADLKAAGLNPVLSAGGAGATTGSGIAAQRSDENVQALYGLTKMAIESSMEQAKAMASTAKYSSGAAGSSNPFRVIEKTSKNKTSGSGNSDNSDKPKNTKESNKDDIGQFIEDAGYAFLLSSGLPASLAKAASKMYDKFDTSKLKSALNVGSVKTQASKAKSVVTGKTVKKAAQNTAKLVSRIKASR